MILTGEQLRGGRAMVRMEQGELAARAGVSVDTIKRLERISGPVSANTLTIAAIQRALEAAGVIFIPEDRHGPGVRLQHTAAFDEALASLVYLHGTDSSLDRVEVIVAGLPEDDRLALSPLFGDCVWGRENKPTDPRGEEIQDRLTRMGAFRS